MATIVTLAAGFLGLICAVLAMVLFHASAFTALTMWFSVGFTSTLLALVWSALPRRDSAMIEA